MNELGFFAEAQTETPKKKQQTRMNQEHPGPPFFVFGPKNQPGSHMIYTSKRPFFWGRVPADFYGDR